MKRALLFSILLLFALCSSAPAQFNPIFGYPRNPEFDSVSIGTMDSRAIFGGPFRGLMASLDHGDSCAFSVHGDSTGDASNEWVYLVAQWLGVRYPTYSVRYRVWSDASQAYSTITDIQTGAEGERYIEFTTTSSSIESGDLADFAADVDIRAKILPTSWAGADQTIFARAATNDLYVRFYLNSSKLRWTWSEDGSTWKPVVSSTVNVPGEAGVPLWVRITWDLDNGAAGNDAKFWISANGVNWTQLGDTVTTATAATLHDSGAAWEIGGYASVQAPFVGKIYRVQVMSDIDGYPVGPQAIDQWHGGTFGGAPVLWVLNGSKSGSDLSYHNDNTRRPKMLLDYGQVASIINDSHNETSLIGKTNIAAYSSYLTNLKAAYPYSAFVLLSQNPRISPAANIREHAIRRSHLFSWAHTQGIGVIDLYPAFEDYSGGITALISAVDGVHPNATGEAVWAGIIERAMLADIPK